MTHIAAFLERLENSHLLTSAALAELRREFADGDETTSPEQIAQRLVDRKELTAWQARMLLANQTAFFLGKYKLFDELGHGGMGTVFMAKQAPIGRWVALKVMAEHLVRDEMAVARFQREIRAAAALNHPHVVTAFDAESIHNTHFLVMEYVAGESLDALLKRERRLPAATACEFVRQAALGLSHAHEMGMAHRDIKPSNLLLTSGADGRPLIKILDMGLARFTSETRGDSELTSTGQVMGTPDYISPEQARSTRAADIRSDIFSLGCTLFRALAGRIPFEGQSVVEKLMARALEEAPSLRLYLPDAPPGLAEVLAKMLACDPTARYQTPHEVVVALQPFCTNAPNMSPGNARAEPSRPSLRMQPAPPPDLQMNRFLQVLAHEAELDEPQTETLTGLAATRHGNEPQKGIEKSPVKGRLQLDVERRSRVERRRIYWTAAGAVLTLVGVLAAWGWEARGRTRLSIDWPVDERSGGSLEVDGMTRLLPERGSIPVIAGRAGRSILQLKRRGYEPIEMSLDFQRGEEKTFRPEWKATLKTARRLRMEELGRSVEAFLNRTDRRLPAPEDADLALLRRQFAEFRPQVRGSPDQPAFEGLWRQLPGPADFLRAADFDGSWALDRVLAPHRPAELVAAFGDGRFKSPAPYPGIVPYPDVVLSPDDSVVVTASSGYLLSVWDLATGQLRFDPAIAPRCTAHLTFSADSKYVACTSQEVVVWSLADKVQKATLAVAYDEVGAMLWIPRTNRLAISRLKSAAVEIWDVDTQQLVERLEGRQDQKPFNVLAASADGRRMAAANNAGDTLLWNLERHERVELPSGPALPTFLAFSRDGRQLARASSGTMTVWDLDPLRLEREVTRAASGLTALDWSSDGQIRMTDVSYNGAMIWNATEQNDQALVATRSRQFVTARLTSDGKRLVTCGSGGEVQIWNALTGEELFPVPPAFTTAAVDPQGEWLALGTNARTIEKRALPGGELLETVSLERPPASIAVSPDGRVLAAVSHYGRSEVGKLAIVETGREVRYLDEVQRPQSPVFTPDGTLLLALSWEELVAWSTADWTVKFKRRLPVPPYGFSMGALVVTSDGRKVIARARYDNKGGIVGYSLPEGKQLYADPFGPVVAMTATTNPRAFLVDTGGACLWFDAEKGKVVQSVPHPYDNYVHTTSLACNPDGTGIICAASDGQLSLMASEFFTFERSLSLGGSQLAAREMHFTPEGRHVVTVNSNGTVYILRIKDWPPGE